MFQLSELLKINSTRYTFYQLWELMNNPFRAFKRIETVARFSTVAIITVTLDIPKENKIDKTIFLVLYNFRGKNHQSKNFLKNWQNIFNYIEFYGFVNSIPCQIPSTGQKKVERKYQKERFFGNMVNRQFYYRIVNNQLEVVNPKQFFISWQNLAWLCLVTRENFSSVEKLWQHLLAAIPKNFKLTRLSD